MSSTENPNSSRPMSTGEVWRRSIQSIKNSRQKAILMAGLFLFLPQVVLSLISAVLASSTTAQIGLAAANIVNTTQNIDSFFAASGISTSFLVPLTSAFFILLLVEIGGMLGMVQMAWQEQTGRPVDPMPTLFTYGLRRSLPSGLLAVLILPVLFYLGQSLILPGLIVAVMGILVPPLLVIEKSGCFQAIWNALTARIRGRKTFHPLLVFVSMSGIAAIFYSGIIGLSFLTHYLANLDLHLGFSRNGFLLQMPGLKMTWVRFGIDLLEAGILSFLLIFLAYASVTTYLLLQKSRYKRV